ncbi:helix-turn-helix domain-containing protein [Bremerella alba]|uniref:HTH cro/C1-type domain-containing protein n=1 Tax=Bremerella alba TaxID=980252 RepID=A0A7V8V1B7_9BACT|nr:hypothetical protein [Bremerella alba]
MQLVEAYEAKHHAIETRNISGIELLRGLLSEHDMNASDLARLLGVHASMGSKLLKGDRSLTVEHLQKLATRFQVRPELFMGKRSVGPLPHRRGQDSWFACYSIHQLKHNHQLPAFLHICR